MSFSEGPGLPQIGPLAVVHDLHGTAGVAGEPGRVDDGLVPGREVGLRLPAVQDHLVLPLGLRPPAPLAAHRRPAQSGRVYVKASSCCACRRSSSRWARLAACSTSAQAASSSSTPPALTVT